jgi:hypothetical protein
MPAPPSWLLGPSSIDFRKRLLRVWRILFEEPPSCEPQSLEPVLRGRESQHVGRNCRQQLTLGNIARPAVKQILVATYIESGSIVDAEDLSERASLLECRKQSCDRGQREPLALQAKDGRQSLQVIRSVKASSADEARWRQEPLGLKSADVAAGRPRSPCQLVEDKSAHLLILAQFYVTYMHVIITWRSHLEDAACP